MVRGPNGSLPLVWAPGNCPRGLSTSVSASYGIDCGAQFNTFVCSVEAVCGVHIVRLMTMPSICLAASSLPTPSSQPSSTPIHSVATKYP